MTVNKIIKGNECCQIGDCEECPYKGIDCGAAMATDTLALINRQKAEIEKQKELTQYILGGANALLAGFAYKVKAKFDQHGVDYTAYTIIDDVMKEMGGNTNAD